MTHIRVVNIAESFSKISECWKPHIAGTVNDAAVKLAKLDGEFIWHHHEDEDEMFLVIRGTLRMRIREGGTERELRVGPGEFLIVPRMTEHLPIADSEVHVMLFEPATTVNTGNAGGTRTVVDLPHI